MCGSRLHIPLAVDMSHWRHIHRNNFDMLYAHLQEKRLSMMLRAYPWQSEPCMHQGLQSTSDSCDMCWHPCVQNMRQQAV